MKKGDILSLKIVDIADKNKYVAKTEDGQVVFIKSLSVALGDTVEASVIKIKQDFLEARLVNITKFSSLRTSPRCNFFGYCGGCKFQHTPYSLQLTWKQKKVTDSFLKIGGFKNIPINPIIKSNELFNYRNKIEFSFCDRRYFIEKEISEISPRLALGFHPIATFKKVIDIDSCDIAPIGSNTLLNAVRAFALSSGKEAYSPITHKGFWRHLVLRYSTYQRGFMVNLVTSAHDKALMQDLKTHLLNLCSVHIITIVNNATTSKGNTALGESQYLVYGKGVIYEKLGSHTFKISPNSFFQTNTAQAWTLFNLALKKAEVKKTDIVYDLCCGSGTISLFFSEFCHNVFGMDISSDSIRDAKQNCLEMNIQNCSFEQLDMMKMKQNIERIVSDHGKPSIIVADPPRSGLHKKTANSILLLNPEKIVYISCNPSTLARDAAIFTESYRFQLKSITPVDMFPQTNHIEAVALFTRNNNPLEAEDKIHL